MIKKCFDCKKPISKDAFRCKSCAKKGILNYFYSKHHSPEFIKRMSGKNHPAWKGEKAKYAAIHVWVNAHKGIATICEKCGITSKETRIEWANKNHKYRRNLNHYFSWCCHCHDQYDLINKLKKNTRNHKIIPNVHKYLN